MKVITIAIGQPYLNMAYNLAASCYGKHDVVLITDQVVGKEYDHLFDTVVEPMYVGETDMETALINKLHLDEYADGEMLFLDADTILFKKFHNDNGNLFTPIVLHRSIKYPEWMSADVACEHYGIEKLVRCNTSWIYFDGTKKSKKVFQTARKVYHDAIAKKYEYRDFRGVICDEMCFDVAMSLHSDVCTVFPNMPLQLPFVRYESKIHLLDSYYGMTMAGGDLRNNNIITAYNSLSKYFCEKVGIGCYLYKNKAKMARNFDDNTPQVVDSCNVEFGYELISALPYAWHLHQKGMLKGTKSAIDTAPFYWFSPNHEIDTTPRHWDNMKKAHKVLPNIGIHNHELDWRYFSPPPLKQQYGWQLDLGTKPVVCICNRINIEWGKEVINYFDIDCLEKLFKALTSKYRVVYFNIAPKKEYADGVDMLDIGDFDLCKKYGVETVYDLQEKLGYQDFSFNHFQLLVFGACKRFITMNGGYSILASYFGGTNIIYSKECREINPMVNSFYRWYHKLGNSRIVHVDTYEKLHERVNDIYVEENPLVNILIRTANRPNAFAKCYESIINQTYKNVNIIVGYHDEDAHQYLIPYKVKPVRYEPFKGDIPPAPNNTEYGKPFAPNHYLDLLNKEVNNGWIMYLDDDDAFATNIALELIVKKIKSDNDLIMWRLRLNDNIILPSDENFGKAPVPRGISGITFMAHSKHVKQTSFGLYRLGDYRVISELYQKLNHVFINNCLTKMQKGECGMGNRNDL